MARNLSRQVEGEYPSYPACSKNSSHVSRYKTRLEYVGCKLRRSVTFSKRKRGIMKKAYELNVMTGSEILLILANENGYVHAFSTSKLKDFLQLEKQAITKYLLKDSCSSEEHRKKKCLPNDYLSSAHENSACGGHEPEKKN